MTRPTKVPRFDQATIASRIREARKAQGYTAASLGAAVGLSEDTLLKKEQGRSPFTLDEFTRICDLLQAPTTFPFVDWDVAKLVDKILERESQ